MTKSKPFAYIGSISNGSMRAEDLIPVFADVLADLDKTATRKALVQEANLIEDYDSEQADDVLSELFDALGEFAPPYFYFGGHPGDGADFGFWLGEDFQRDMKDDDVLMVDDLAEIPAGFEGAVALVTDHGNVSFGNATAGGVEWSWEIV
jgi:hypothetical protein